jgi:glycosyltransferase involved in cell wall biosynthesis
VNADLSPDVPSQRQTAPTRFGIVAIGRNEGDRLKRCLSSIKEHHERIVYVDSGSTDGSLEASRAFGVTSVELDMRTPFTAARARNDGFRKLLEREPDLDYVFFVDGDCEIVPGWLQKAHEFLDRNPECAVVWGRRTEKHPEHSIYNLLCDIEWSDYPLGMTKTCGGDAMVRVAAFRQVNGYRPDLICGEEPEMCVRLRAAGWTIWHLDDGMTLHDAAIYHFGQWWKRMLRGGYGFAQGSDLHGAAPERHGVTESRRAWSWGFLIPCAVLILCVLFGSRALWLLCVYPIQIVRLALAGKRSSGKNWLRAVALVVGKFPEFLGQLKFLADKYRNVQSRLIEYK